MFLTQFYSGKVLRNFFVAASELPRGGGSKCPFAEKKIPAEFKYSICSLNKNSTKKILRQSVKDDLWELTLTLELELQLRGGGLHISLKIIFLLELRFPESLNPFLGSFPPSPPRLGSTVAIFQLFQCCSNNLIM